MDAAGGREAMSSALRVSGSEFADRLTDDTGIADLLDANPDAATWPADLQNRKAVVDGYA